MKILMVGSRTRHFLGVKTVLEQQDFGVEIEHFCSTGLQHLESDPKIDLVVLDADSIEEFERFLRTVRNSPRLRSTPVLVTMQTLTTDDLLAYRRLGASDVVLLPCQEDTLLAKVQAADQHGKRTVLVVDDEVGVIEVLSSFLELERFKPLTAGSAEGAIGLLEQHSVHAVVTDIGLPGMSGLDLLVVIKARWPCCPVILITGRASGFRPEQVTENGADGYFAKPFSNIELIATLRRVLQRAEPGPLTNAGCPTTPL